MHRMPTYQSGINRDVEETAMAAIVPTIDPDAMEEFEAAFHGRVVRPGDADYREARQVWNAMIDKRPAVIARCTGAADVITAVDFARDLDLLLSVKGGGHNVAAGATIPAGQLALVPLSASQRRSSV